MGSEKCSTSGCKSELLNSEEKKAKLCWYCKCEKCHKLIPESIRETSLICQDCKDGKKIVVEATLTKKEVQSTPEDSALGQKIEKVAQMKETTMECNNCGDDLEKDDEKFNLCGYCRCTKCDRSLEENGASAGDQFCKDCSDELAEQVLKAKSKGKQFEAKKPNGVKEFAAEVGVRTAAKQLNKQSQRILIGMMTKHLKGKQQSQAVGMMTTMLESAAGEALMGIILSYVLDQAPAMYAKMLSKEMPENMRKNLERLAHEAKFDGVSTATSEVVGAVLAEINGDNFKMLKDFLTSPSEDTESQTKKTKAPKKAVEVAEAVHA